MSRSVRVVLSIYAWLAVVILPAVLTLAGVFGDVGPETEIGGALIGVWLGCFCAQLALVYVTAHALGHTREWWFVVASLLPWVVDWAAPYGLGWGLLWIGVAGLVAAAMAWLAVRSVTLDE